MIIMCIAVYKPAGQKVPSKKTLSNCFSNNSDGAGYMFAYNGVVHIEKGLMTFNAFKKSLKSTIKKYGGDSKGFDLPMVFHFRISTQGGVNQELTHPFMLSDNYDDMKKLSTTCDRAIAHNGIIHFASSYNVKDHNDTMEFIKKVAYPLINKKKDYFKDKKLMGVFDYLLDGNRIVILDGNGHAEMIGNWVEDNGVFYSNSSYKEKSVLSSFKSTSSIIYRPYNAYDDYDYLVSKPKFDDSMRPATSEMVDELYKANKMTCPDCGKEIVIEWDNYEQSYIGYCMDCGETFLIDEETGYYAETQGLCGYERYEDDEDYYGKLAYGR